MKFTCLAASAALFAMTSVSAIAGDREITAVGHAYQSLRIAGPDQAGRYSLRVYIADLDPASAAGGSAMSSRVAMGTSLLCGTAAPQPYPGYYYREQRECRSQSGAIAGAQMLRARDLARSGDRVAWLDVAR